MNVRRSWLFFLVMLLLSACAILLLAEKQITGDWNTLRDAPGEGEWQSVGTGNGKVAAAAGWQGDALLLRYFTTDGERLSEQSLTLPEDLAGGSVCRLLPVRERFA